MNIWDVFELLVAIPDVFENWRFYLCLLLSLGTAGGIYWLAGTKTPSDKSAIGSYSPQCEICTAPRY